MDEEKKDLIDVITKIVTAASVLIAGIAIPVVLNHNQEKNRQSQLYVQVMSQREQRASGAHVQRTDIILFRKGSIYRS